MFLNTEAKDINKSYSRMVLCQWICSWADTQEDMQITTTQDRLAEEPRLAKNWACTLTSTKKTLCSAKYFKQKWKLLPHYATESVKYMYSNKILYIFVTFFCWISNQMKYEWNQIRNPTENSSQVNSLNKYKLKTESSGRSLRRQDWEWGLKSGQFCGAVGVMRAHGNHSHIISPLSKLSLLLPIRRDYRDFL